MMHDVDRILIMKNLVKFARKLQDRKLDDDDALCYQFPGNVEGTYYTIRVEKKYGRFE